MTRCDYDAVFYRVFCITLIAIAFTFTLILTNVFVDIDGLLSKKEKGKYIGVTEKVRSVLNNDYTTQSTYNEEMIYEEREDSYRTKRSLESQNFLFHIENPKVKTVLKKKLANLLEDLDEEEPLHQFKPTLQRSREEYNNEKLKSIKKDSEILHLAMHNVLLQGIIGHMDLSEVYKRIRGLINNFKRNHQDGDIREDEPKPMWKTQTLPKDQALVEENFFDEIVNCKELENQIANEQRRKDEPIKNNVYSNNDYKDSNVLIKTLIDITSKGKDKVKEDNKSYSKENVKGVVKLIYNGKNVKFTKSAEDYTQKLKKPIKMRDESLKSVTGKLLQERANRTNPSDELNYRNIPESYMNKFIEEYFKKFTLRNNESAEKSKEVFQHTRSKRDIKVKYENSNKISEKTKIKGKADDDELYVEIETHFDSKGMKGEKKKKLIRNLIQKIQKAIHSDMGAETKKKRNDLHVKKRIQNPLENINKLLMNKITAPYNNILHRQINPIIQMQRFHDLYTAERSAEIWKNGNIDYVTNKSGEMWKRPYVGPGFLTETKALNSAELSEVDVDYNKVLSINGIPQRLQKPLNIDSSDEQSNTFYDLGNLKFYIKDAGAGLSIGFNQYVDEPPDTDSIKLFTSVENIVNTYHQNYDPTEQTTESIPKIDLVKKNPERSHDDSKTDDHIIVRRSINQHDQHSNEYKIIFDNNFLPYESYQEIYDKPKKNSETKKIKKIINSKPLIIDEEIFSKNLKPAEIFGLADLFQRKKRSVNVKKISNIRSKMKINRFLNTHVMGTKRIYMNKKRNKRQINKIRIIATDLPHVHRHSDENIYIVSDENMFADRAIVRDEEAAQLENEEYQQKPEELYENPEEESQTIHQSSKLFDSKSRHNALSSKYPHIFMEEITKSKEEFGLDNAYLFSKLFNHDQNIERTSNNVVNIDSIAYNSTAVSPRVEQAFNSLGPKKSNIKVTVKVMPKNGTGLNSGFKEVHTSINKSYNKNGLLYSSLVNVSEISKIIKLNKTNNNVLDTELSRTIKEQQEKMQFLLKQHKEHLDDQLEQLNVERTKLESMLKDSNSNNPYNILSNDFVELIMPSNPNQIILVSKDKMNEIAANALVKNITSSTIITTTTSTTTPNPIKDTTTPVIDRRKSKTMNSLERNENLTYQIINKIDRNTQILEIFLKKLADTIAKPPKEDIFKKQPLNFDHNAMIVHNNGSHMSIPFLYAYQQPIQSHKENKVASVVYHGHIHTNALDHGFKKPEENKILVNTTNQTKFFIDELENDYKVIAVRDTKEPISNNTIA